MLSLSPKWLRTRSYQRRTGRQKRWRRMLEEDDEPKRASGETKPELRVAESQTDSPEEEIKESKGEEEKEKQDQEEREVETSQIQEKKEEEEEEEEVEEEEEKEKEEKKKKEKTLEEEHEDKSQIIENKTNIDEQETNEVKIKTDEQPKDAEVEEERELPQVKSDKEDNSKEKQEGDKGEDIIKDTSEQSTESSLNKEAEGQTEVCNTKEESPEATQQETSASQDNSDKDLPQENVGVAKQVVEEEEQELVSPTSSDQQTNAAGLDQTPEARSEKVEEEDMLVEPLKEESEEMAESEESNPTSQKMTSGKSENGETVPETINNNTTDSKEKINTDQEMEDSPLKEGKAAQEGDKEGVDMEINDTEQNKNDNPAHTETAAEKGTPPPSGDANSDVDVEDVGDVGKPYTPEKGGEDLNAEDQDENYDELNDSDDDLELKICIEGITEVGENADETSEEAAESEVKTGEDKDQETEEMPLCEEAMEVDEAMEEGGNDDDVECDEVNGLGAIEDDEDLNDEEFISEDTTNSSFQDGGSLPQCRLKRNYTCVHCGINTQNPREYLYHLRDDHGEKMKVFECSHCIYASKNHQKLIRHARMVHKVKIKKQEASPCKPPSKPAVIAPTTNKLTRASVSPGKSSRSSPGKSPRSNDSAQDEWDVMDEEDDQEFDQDGSPIKGDEKKLYFCEQCSYSCRSRKLLNRHETSYHLKRRFFRCVKCNYVTHLKGRYTKHLKYHQLPILKCDFCDFRTPYRWNLDRHLKNHTEECGEFKCHLCNFTAQIKQSLTVHISNHHLTSEQIRERERRRTIGISDPADCAFDDQEMELMRLERDEHPDALIAPGYDGPDSPTTSELAHGQHNGNNSFRVSNIDVSGQDDSQVNADDGKDEDGEPKKKKPKIKITLKKMKVSKPKDTFFQELNERHNFEEDFIHPDDVVHRHGNVYIKNFKCRFCTFKAAFKNEIMRHEKKVHSTLGPKAMGQVKKARKTIKSSKVLRSSSSDDVLTQILQFPQNENKDESEEIIPAECLQKLGETEEAVSDLRDDEGSSKDKDEAESENLNEDQEDSMEAVDEQSPNSKESSPSKDSAKKKNLSFFEKLQEKMPTSNVQNLVCQFCGHESKCLSESVRHQKLHLSAKNIYAPASLSTRCQFCRHRCKTTDDLMSHLKLCPEARKNQITDSGRRASGSRLDENEDSQCSSERGENADYDDNEEDSMNEVADKTPVLVDGTVVKREDMKHPMENRVFVWNNIEKSDDQEKSSVEKREKVNSGSRRSSTESNKRKRSGSKSPVDMEGSLDYYIESPTPKGHHYYTKRVYRCPQCSFWATTASRFHVHIVGHFNRKPYNCSECGYKSNWRWDITKHIKLKTSRDSSHQNAQVLITDETGEKNYEKYDCYLAIIQLDETNAHRTEGGIPTRKGRPKRTPEKDEVSEPVTPSASPIRKPPMVAIPVMPRLQAMPRLTRAPGRSTPTSRPGPMPFGPILPGAQLMVQIAGSRASGSSSPRPPPPLTPKGALKSGSSSPSSSTTTTATTKITSSGNTAVTNPVAGGQYQIITPQGSVNTSLETLQLLASGSTNLSKLKKQQKSSLLDSEEKDSKATLSHQVSVSSTGEDGKEVAKMVLDHEGNPEWKCNTCDFRDSERETVVQHVRLAHTRNGPVSLLHAVHRCDVCGYAAGTKRAVQLHIDSSHGGQGGITSRCEGQNPDTKESGGDAENAEYSENARTYHCRQCPFTCKKRSEMKPHLTYHTERSDCIFKCMFCPYYVPTRNELFEHLRVHGMEVPSSIVDATNKNSSSPISSQDDVGGPRQFICSACPFETRSRAKLMHHKQFHKPKGLPFRCPHCTYNVTRRHLLSQHIRVHGIEDTLEGNGNGDVSQMDDRSNSPSPSLTITPVTNAATGSTGEDSALTDSSNLPKLTDESTTRMEDIPLVWVSRDHRFFKMFKCRHCPHVNLRKTNIQEHEKMHKTDISKEAGGLHCPYCSYVSVNAGVMSAHLKVHGGSMGQCHAVVDPSLSDEDQLKQLTSRGPAASTETTQAAADKLSNWKNDEKILYYCQRCPARFFLEKEIQIHSRFHNTSLPHTCDHCNYGTRQPAHLLTHLKVHTPEYQQRTRSMMGQHRTAASYPPVPGLTIPHELADLSGDKHSAKEAGGSGSCPFSSSPPPAPGVMPQPPPTSKYMCDQCPATFSKLVTLQYHQSLHGTKNPHPCPKCTYAGKTWDSLQQHILLHNQYDQNCQAEKAASESAKKAEAQKALEASLSSKISQRTEKDNNTSSIPPLKLKLIGPRPGTGENNHDGSRPQFKYYVEEQVPLSGVDLLRRKTQMEKEGDRHFGDVEYMIRPHVFSKSKGRDDEEEDPKRIGDPLLHYPLHIDKVTGKSREKRYKCSKCPSAFEKVEQYTVHTNLHGSSHKYRCRICDYSVKFYANFMMHIKRHKYHERMEAQTSGQTPPLDNDSKYEPIVSKENSSQGEKVVSSKTQNEEHSNKENLEEADLTTIERQHLLLQNKKGVGEAPKKDDERERRVYYCQYCPYANIRRDAVDSHSMRHRANGGFGSYKCTFCDYTASQPNFIREHTKVHFRPFKYVHPEGFMRHDRQEIFSIPVGEGTKAGNKQKSDGSSQSALEKYVIYSHEVGNANPAEESEGEEEENVNPEMVKSIQVNFHSGDIVEAPFDYVVSLRPKSKAAIFHLEANDVTNISSEVAEKVERMNPEAAVPSTSGENGSVGTEQAPQKDESMEVDENTSSGENEKTEMQTEPSEEPESLVEDHAMETESTKETESPKDTENLQNGHVEEIHEVTKPPVKSQENVKVSESKLNELSQPLGKSKGSTPSES